MFWLPSVTRSSAFEVFLVNALVALSYGERYVYGPEAQVSGGVVNRILSTSKFTRSHQVDFIG